MILRLYSYFGLVGILSILAWMASVAMFARYAARKEQTIFCVRALLVALVAWMFAAVNSHNVSLIQADRSEEMREAMERQMKARAEEMKALNERAADIRFAEDDKYDHYDLAGVAGDEKKSIYELAAEGKDVEPLYRQAGKQTRTESGEVRAPEAKGGTNEAAVAGENAFHPEPGVKMLPEKARVKATRLSWLNLRISRFVVILALILLLYDYFSRFNTPGCVLPLPFSGRMVDQLFPKKRSLLLRAGDRDLARAYLEMAVRKGESFLYFGPRDMADDLNLARVHIPYRLLWRDFLRAVYYPSLVALAGKAARFPWRNMARNARLHILQLPGALAIRSRCLWAVARIGSISNAAWRDITAAASKIWGKVAGLARRDDEASRSRLSKTRTPIRERLSLVARWAGRRAEAARSSGAWRGFVQAVSLSADRGKRGVRVSFTRSVAWVGGKTLEIRQSNAWRVCVEAAGASASSAKRFIDDTLHSITVKDGALDVCPANLMTIAPDEKPFSYDFIFESAWFGRYCFAIGDPAVTVSMAESLLEFLGDRYRPRAVAWRTVHIVWNLDAGVISRENLENLLFLAREANFKLVLFAPDPANSALKPLLEESEFSLTSSPRLP